MVSEAIAGTWEHSSTEAKEQKCLSPPPPALIRSHTVFFVSFFFSSLLPFDYSEKAIQKEKLGLQLISMIQPPPICYSLRSTLYRNTSSRLGNGVCSCCLHPCTPPGSSSAPGGHVVGGLLPRPPTAGIRRSGCSPAAADSSMKMLTRSGFLPKETTETAAATSPSKPSRSVAAPWDGSTSGAASPPEQARASSACRASKAAGSAAEWTPQVR